MIFAEALEVDLGGSNLLIVLPFVDAIIKVVFEVSEFFKNVHIGIATENPHLRLYFITELALLSRSFRVLQCIRQKTVTI